MSDAGTYTLRGENRNGSDKVFIYAWTMLMTSRPDHDHGDATTQVDLDLVVLETGHDVDCELLKAGNLECRCAQSFR